MQRLATLGLGLLVAAGPITDRAAGPAQAPGPSPTPAASPEGVTVTVAGSSLFRTYCAACHGLDAQGDGPLADRLRVRPADLTLLARHHKGSFDKEKVMRIVDGRNPVKGHGDSDMPVWGDAFRQSEEGFSEKKVAARIGALVDYLAEIQKP